ncbi:MAG TPA: hypothetical protein VI669_16740 [Vicinamibacteria bacterium]
MKRLATLGLVVVSSAWFGCARQAPVRDPARMAALQDTYQRLHARLEKAAAAEPLVASAFADPGQVAVAMRSGLIEELAGRVARRYLDHVTLDLAGVEASSSGELRRKTFLGRFKLGEWSVSVEVGDLVGDLRAGPPRVRLRAPNLIDVEVPAEVKETEGGATIHFGWNSKSLANVVCKDFDLTRDIRGRVLAQKHVLSGALQLENSGETLTATPLFPDRRVQLKLDLTPRSWVVVEEALRSQDSFGKCGMVMDPDRGLVKLRELAARGIGVQLPESIFRKVSLPARLRQAVKVDGRTVGLRLKAESLRVESGTLWSSVTVQVATSTKP